MPEEITQKLGFDASQAVEALLKLRQSLNNLKQSLTSVGTALGKFNQKAKPATASMKTMGTAARSAASAVLKLSSAMKTSQAAVGQAGKGLQTTTTAARNLAGGYSQAVAGMGISTQAMATQVAASNTKATTAVTKTGAAMQQAGQTVQKASKGAGAAAATMGKKMQQAGVAGTKAAQTMTVSWTTVFRVIQAQVIIRAFSSIITAMQSSTKAAVEFQTAIAEIKTISPPLLGDMAKISHEVRELGKNLSVSAQVIAEGLYQTLSNQVVGASDAFEFLARAQKLAVITTAETKDAVNALSSVMNSYRMSAEDTEHVAGTLFKTVELGRLRLNEFADILGRVTPLTADLGIEWEEVAASLAVMTRQGVKVNTALTQLRAIVLKLIKPTDEMRKLFRQWGVKDAQQAIKKFGGLVGLLKELAKESGGASAEMAKYFNRVRAIAGQMGIMTGEGKLMEETLAEIKGSTTEATEAFEEFSQVPAFRINKALSAIQITFEELASKALPFLADTLEYIVAIIPSVNEMASAFKTLGSVVIGIGAVLATLTVAFTKTFAKISDSIGLVLTELNKFGPRTKSVAALIADIWLEPTDNAAKFFNFLAEESEKQVKQFADTRREILKTDKEHWTQLTKNAWEYFSEISLVWQQLEAVVEAGIESTAKVTGRMWDNVIKDGKNAIKDLANLQDNFRKRMASNAKDASNAEKRFDEQDYNLKSANAKGLRKDKLLSGEVEKSLREARSKFSKKDISEENYKHGLEMTHRAQELAIERLKHAKELGNRGAVNRAQKQLTKARNVEKQAISNQGRLIEKANSLEAQNFRNLVATKQARMDALHTEWVKLQKERAKQEDDDSEASSKLRERALKIESEIRKEFLTDEERALAKKLGADTKALKNFEDGIDKALKDANFAWDVELVRLQSLISQTIFELKTNFGDIDDQGLKDAISETIGRGRLPHEDIGQFLGKGFDKASEKLQELKKDELDMQGVNTKLQQTYAGVVATMRDMNLEAVKISKAPQGTPAHLVKLYRETAKAQRKTGLEEDKRFDDLKSNLQGAAEDTVKLGVVRTDNLEIMKREFAFLKESGRLTKENANLITQNFKNIEEAAGSAARKKEHLEKWEDQPVEAYKKVVEGIGQKQGDWAKTVEKTKDQTKKISTETGTIRNKTSDVTTQAGFLKNSYVTSTAELKNQTEQRDKHLSQADQLIEKERTLAQITSSDTGVLSGVDALDVEPDLGSDFVGLEAQTVSTSLSMEKLEAAINKVADPLSDVTTGMNSVEASTGNSATEASGLIETWDQLGERIAASFESINNLVNLTADAKVAADKVKTAWDNVNNSLGSVVTAANAVTEAMKAAAAASRAAASAARDANAAAAGAGAGGGNAYKGGPAIQYRESGGTLQQRFALPRISASRGFDRIPIMASPGEFVMNARSANRFSSELRAMNSGARPIFRDQGGSVTNIGDVNVTVGGDVGSSTPNQTARDIGSALRRELRRSTISASQMGLRSGMKRAFRVE